ncbi:MAG TPA: hypothetical protein VM778_11270, partial [Gemmatimonadota bacterium]|nr:hypothetical protein [Gemmatimonadota bacterium]
MTRPAPTVFLYGAGRVARAVAALATERGVRVAGAWSRGRPGADGGIPGVVLTTGPEPPAEAADVWLLAVADDGVEDVAARLA